MDQSATVRHCAVFIAAVVAVYALKWGESILVPLVLAILLMDLLSPLVDRMHAWRVPDAIAVTLVTLAVALVILVGLVVVSRQVYSLTAELPNYGDNIIAKVHGLRGSGSAFRRLIDIGTQVSSELSPTPPPTSRPATRAVPVEVVPAPGTAVSVARGVITPLIFPITQFGIMLTYLFFLLLNRSLITGRVDRLMTRARVGIASDVVDDASRRVGQYLRSQLRVNACYAVAVFIVMRSFGLPSAMLLAVIAAVLRYVPYIGPMVGFALPTLIGVAVFEGWWASVAMLGCIVAIEVLTSSVVEPLLYGSRTGVSSLGVVLSTFFWGWVWGPIGLILALPITVWLVSVGRYFPGLRSLSMLLSAEQLDDQKPEGTC